MTTASSSHTGAHHGSRGSGSTAAATLWLDEPGAVDPAVTGVKAATLARAIAAGFDVLPGFVITTSPPGPVEADVRAPWEELTGGGSRPLVVRSSSTIEDLAGSSMAGRFDSVVGVEGWDAFVGAVEVVLRSAGRVVDGDVAGTAPMAVLVQPLLDAVIGGVLFGVDPVTGRCDRTVVAVGYGAPHALVAGEVDGDRYELAPSGRVVAHVPGTGGASLTRRQAGALARLARRAARAFAGPQDVEWAIDRAGVLWLLQSRPVTVEPAGVPTGPLFGPGPVAESFPEALSRLEEELWLPPLERSLRTVFGLVGSASRAALAASPLVVSLEGRVAVDLTLLEGRPPPGRRRSRLALGGRVRRLRAAWRIGRLRAALPSLAADLLARVDDELLAVPPIEDLTHRQHLALLGRVGQALEAVHGHEILLGLLLSRDAPRFTGGSVALRVLAAARADGLDDEEIASRHPVVLALVAPHVQPFPPLPVVGPIGDWAPLSVGDPAALLREALRLRIRWLQELSGRAAWSLGQRLVDDGILSDPSAVRHLGLDDLSAIVTGRALPLDARPPTPIDPPPLPVRFQLTDRGRPVAVATPGRRPAGTGAGGGRGRGVVFGGPGDPPHGAVLVVGTLDPRLAPSLGHLGGLVAETGSVLAHVAILARELGVPTVVGVADARDRFPPGALVTVDGSSGEVTIEEQA